MLILGTIIMLSLMSNIPLYFMLRYSADPRNELRGSAIVWDVEIPDLTFDSRGLA